MTESHYQFLPNRPIDRADVLVLPVPHELTVSYRTGTRNGPEAILGATEQLEYYEEDGGWSPFRHMGVAVLPTLDKRLYEGESDFHARLSEYARSLPAGPLLLSLGGEHSITASLVAGRMATPGTIVLLDAHADLRREFEGSAFSHACPMHRIREAGHRILMIGVRSLYEQEAARIAGDPGVDCFMDRALRRPDTWDRLMRELAQLNGPVYLTVDMDAFDPAAVAGVGTPQPGGLSWYQGVDVVTAVMGNPHVEIAGCDLVETVPEPSCVADMTAAKLSQKMISAWGRCRGYHRRPEAGSQTEVSYE